MNFDGERRGERLAVRMINANNESCGHFVTQFIPGKFRPTPLQLGRRYEWTLNYDPDANNGGGQFTYTLSGFDRDKDPIDSPISVDLPPGFKKAGATFNRFGIVNTRKAGGSLAFYMNDLAVNEQKWDFSTDPQWDGHGTARRSAKRRRRARMISATARRISPAAKSVNWAARCGGQRLPAMPIAWVR